MSFYGKGRSSKLVMRRITKFRSNDGPKYGGGPKRLTYIILCYVMLRYVTLRYVVLCYVMLSYVTLRSVKLCYVTLRHVKLRCVALCYVMLCYIILYCILYYIILFYIILYYIILYYIILYYIILYYIILYYIIDGVPPWHVIFRRYWFYVIPNTNQYRRKITYLQGGTLYI